MAEAPSPAAKSADLPTIIIDPSLYEPERPSQTPSFYGSFMRLTRVTLAAGAVGTATFAVAHTLELDSLLWRQQVSARTATVPERVTQAVAPQAVAAAQEAPAPLPAAPEVAEVLPAAPVAAVESAVVATAEASPSALAPSAEVKARAPAAPTREPALTSAAASEPEKSAKKAPSLDDDVRAARRLLAMNRLEEAEAAYRGVLAVESDKPSALTGLARVQLARGQLDDAFASAKRAVEKAPSVASAHLTLGDVLRARGDKSAAQSEYDQAAQLASTQGSANAAP